MTDGPEWFAPKRYGLGTGLPIAWQGWAVTVVAIALMLGTAWLFNGKPAVIVAVVVPLMIAFILITALTTKGGWRWRWGEDE